MAIRELTHCVVHGRIDRCPVEYPRTAKRLAPEGRQSLREPRRHTVTRRPGMRTGGLSRHSARGIGRQRERIDHYQFMRGRELCVQCAQSPRKQDRSCLHDRDEGGDAVSNGALRAATSVTTTISNGRSVCRARLRRVVSTASREPVSTIKTERRFTTAGSTAAVVSTSRRVERARA